MSFILSEQRDENVTLAFKNYEAYIVKVKDKLPPHLLEMIQSDWYFNFNDHRCPHDAWLKTFVISENQASKLVDIKITLLGAYHDMELEFRYKGVSHYNLKGWDLKNGHNDWRYDEFRISESGKIIHEVEWRPEDTEFIIEAEEIYFEFKPIS